MLLWLTDSYVHRCLSSGSLASRKRSGSPGTYVAGFSLCPVGKARQGGAPCSPMQPHLEIVGLSALKFCDALSHWPQETFLETDHIAFFSFSFFFSDWTHLPTFFADSQGHCSSLPCKVLYKCGVLGRATTGFVFSLHQAKSLPFLAVPSPPSSRIPAKCC